MINVNKLIYSKLSGITGTEIYPIVLPETAKLPCIVFSRSGSMEDTKAGRTTGTIIVTIDVLAEKYEDSITIAEAVDTQMKKLTGDISTGGSTYHIFYCILRDFNETVTENFYSYNQTMTYELKIAE